MFKLASKGRNRGSKLLALLPLMLLGVITTGTAFGQSIHFVSTSASVDGEGNLVVSFKEAGLGNDATISYLATANATADYGCLNGGGKNPKAANKRTVSGPVSGTGTFSSGKNGSISASLTLASPPPPPPSSFSCPGGQTLVLADISYSAITLADDTNSIVEDIAGTYVRTFFKF